MKEFKKNQVVEVCFVDNVGPRWIKAKVIRPDHRWADMYDVKPLGPDIPPEMGSGVFMAYGSSLRPYQGGAA